MADSASVAEAEADAAGADEAAERLARYYDLDLRDDPGDADFYVALAARAGGRVLELACGTGRLLEPLAAAGHEVVGVDVDRHMLVRAERRLSAVVNRADGTGPRLELVCADLLDVDLGARFGFAFIALNSLLLLGDAERQAGALAALQRHLRPGGLAVVDVWLPGADDLGLYDGRLVAEWTRRDPDTAELVSKVVSAAHDQATATVELDAWYDAWPASGGPLHRTWHRDRLRLVTADELVRMARAAGLEVDTLARDYHGTPFGPGADRVVLVGRLV